MKKTIIFAAAALVAMASCTKTQSVQSPAANNQIPMRFSQYIGRPANPATKGEDIVAGALESGSISVIGWTTPAQYFASTTFTWKAGASQNYFISNPVYYWPLETTSGTIYPMSFYAVRNGATHAAPEGFKADGSNHAIIENYTIPAAVANQKDLLVASVGAVEYPDTTEATKALNFKHALSKVNFRTMVASAPAAGETANPDDATKNFVYEITKFKVKVPNSVGTYTFDNTVGNYGTWALASPATAITSDYLKDGDTKADISNENYFAWEATDNMNLYELPQTGAVEITIAYKVYYADSTKTVVLADFTAEGDERTVTINLGGTTGDITTAAWEAGYAYTYNLILPLGTLPITFTATVTDWDNGGEFIIKDGDALIWNQ